MRSDAECVTQAGLSKSYHPRNSVSPDPPIACTWPPTSDFPDRCCRKGLTNSILCTLPQSQFPGDPPIS